MQKTKNDNNLTSLYGKYRSSSFPYVPPTVLSGCNLTFSSTNSHGCTVAATAADSVA